MAYFTANGATQILCEHLCESAADSDRVGHSQCLQACSLSSMLSSENQGLFTIFNCQRPEKGPDWLCGMDRTDRIANWHIDSVANFVTQAAAPCNGNQTASGASALKKLLFLPHHQLLSTDAKRLELH